MQNKAAEYMDRAEKLKPHLQTQATGIPMEKKLPIINRSPASPGIPLVLPPSTSTKRFEDYIVQAENICGANNVKIITSAEETYKNLVNALDMLNLNTSDRENLLVSAIIRPCKTSETQDIVRLCNSFEILIWSFSSGGDGDYRAAIPRVPGSIGLDFGRYMNKVLDKKLDKTFRLNWPEYMGGLVLGNIAEGNMFTLYCGKEIILPNGDLLKTGMIQLPGIQPIANQVPQVEQPETKKNQVVQTAMDVFNGKLLPENGLGIAVKVAICLTPNRVDCQPYQIEFSKDDNLHQIVHIAQRLRQKMTLQGSLTLHYVLLDVAIHGPKSSSASSNAALSDGELDRISTNRWRLNGTIYGEKRVRSALFQIINEAFSLIEGAIFTFLVEGVQQEHSALYVRSKQPGEITSIDEPGWTKWIPNGSHVFFRLTSEISGEMAISQYSITKKRIQEAEFDFMSSFTIDGRQMHYILYIVYERYDSDSRRRVHKLIRTLMGDCAENGWTEYWTYGALMDQIAATRDTPDNAMAKINSAIKDAVDPAGIMEPGRNSIWPTRSDKSVWKRMADRSLVE
ncbi:hypothetical protein VE03_06250 [Pseudogymnoascus sp. 23342-1-I1]|nr:hypothetical protein VE03_06250 [Pseudogymnoascus sp. 23342-1-I1]